MKFEPSQQAFCYMKQTLSLQLQHKISLFCPQTKRTEVKQNTCVSKHQVSKLFFQMLQASRVLLQSAGSQLQPLINHIYSRFVMLT